MEDATLKEWFTDDKYGLFIHLGLYSVAARHEWVQTLEEINSNDYQKYFDNFNPDLLNPYEWAKDAKRNGFKYVIITAKHHEGFCLWDTQYTDFKVTNTSAGKDILKELIDAFRKEGLRIGLYYSLLDWHHPNFKVDGYHPMRNNDKYIEIYHEDMGSYRKYMINQITELLTNYGKIDYLWFDFSYESRNWGKFVGKGSEDWGSEELEKIIYELQPDILLNDRLGLSRGVKTPEQFSRSKGMKGELWETVQTLNNSWGYDRDNNNFKSSELVVKQLIDTVSKGGNFTINVGPTARGEWDDQSKKILQEVGAWLSKNGQSIYGATSCDFDAPNNCCYTQKGKKIYLHIFSWPYRTIVLPNLGNKVAFARLLSDGSEIRFVDKKNIGGEREATDNLYKEVAEVHIKEAIDPSTLLLNIPIRPPKDLVPVIELTLK
ncbi:alpha-L-fucosidase [Enterococcus cecorum]|uniref:alpha-L-fucosidase n=1 Tax=Enterococcus cecorum TaxID=44008 RepID=A0A1Y4QY12_9ENTE|nr:alpha-L-fucosidase [Enterococcus cecorum]OUQ10226.1 alpha-L-fucosidase [Enterococcus cecorum]